MSKSNTLSLEQVVIDDEFRRLIPPIASEELELLKQSVAAEGFRESLIVWRELGILVDGHNRHQIWQRSYATSETHRPTIRLVSFANRDEAREWIVRNQLGRRNLRDIDRIELALALKPILERRARAAQAAAGGNRKQKPDKPPGKSLPQNLGEAPRRSPASTPKKREVRAEIAKAAGVSAEQVRKAEVILDRAPAEIRDAVKAGQQSIHKGYKAVEKIERAAAKGDHLLDQLPGDEFRRFIVPGAVGEFADGARRDLTESEELQKVGLVLLQKATEKFRAAIKAAAAACEMTDASKATHAVAVAFSQAASNAMNDVDECSRRTWRRHNREIEKKTGHNPSPHP